MKRHIPHRSDSNFTSDIVIDNQRVTKTVLTNGLPNFDAIQLQKLRHELFLREVYWLQLFDHLEFTPNLLYADHQKFQIVMSYVGERLNDSNAPPNLYQQLFHISQQLMKLGCFYNDWKPENLTVLNDRIHIIDFGWCPLIVKDYSISGVPSIVSSKPGGEQWLS